MCNFIKGVGTGMMLGVALGVGLSMDKRRSKKMIHRAVRSMEDMVERVTDAVGM